MPGTPGGSMFFSLARHTIVLALTLFLSTGRVVSQDIPQFEGVYIYASGDWQKLSPLRKGYENLQVRSTTGDTVTSLRHSLITLNDPDFSPVTLNADAPSQKLRILVVSRTEQFQRINNIVQFDTYVRDIAQELNPGGYAVASGRYAVGTWGWSRDAFQTRLLDGFATEHAMSLPGYGTFGSPSYGRDTASGKAFHVAEGLAVVTNLGVYAFRLSGARPEEPAPADQRSAAKTIGPDALWAGISYSACGNDLDIGSWLDCLVREGASGPARDFAALLASDSAIRMAGVLTEFHETGMVDVGLVMFPSMANTNEQHLFLNVAQKTVMSVLDLVPVARPADDGTINLLRDYPSVGPFGAALVVSVRVLADGTERFTIAQPIAECRACDQVGTALAHADFRNGTLVRVVSAGWLSSRLLAQAPPMDAVLDRGKEAILQARLTILGYQPGGIDGYAGANTVTALNEFQADRCLLASDRLSAEAIAALSADLSLRPSRPVQGCSREASAGPLPLLDGTYSVGPTTCDASGRIVAPAGQEPAFILRGSSVQFGESLCRIESIEPDAPFFYMGMRCAGGVGLEPWNIKVLSQTSLFQLSDHSDDSPLYERCQPGGKSPAPSPSDVAVGAPPLRPAAAAVSQELYTAYAADLNAMQSVAAHADLAVLAWAAYGQPEAIAEAKRLGWSLMRNLAGESSFGKAGALTGDASIGGVAVASLFTSATGEAVLAFRGSVTAGDWYTNTVGSLQALDVPQVSDAVRMAEEVAAEFPAVTFVGHSLGGRLAQAARLATGNKAVVFNSAPLGLAEQGDRIVKAILDGLQGSLANPADLVRFRNPEDALTGVFSPDDIIVANVVPAEAVKSLPGGAPWAVYLGYAIADQMDVAHNIAMMAGAMQVVDIAWTEGWIAAHAKGAAQD